jgi:hypothetical protein
MKEKKGNEILLEMCGRSKVYIYCIGISNKLSHYVQTDPAKNVWTRAYLIPERNRTVRRQEEGKNSVYTRFRE